MINALRQLFLLAALTLLGFAFYVLLFWAGVAASITILFYRGVGLAIAAALFTGVCAFAIGRRISDTSLPIASAALSLSFNLCFLVLFPVTVDRSVTVYLLSTIEQRREIGIDSSDLEHSFI